MIDCERIVRVSRGTLWRMEMKIHALWSLPLLPLRDGWFFGLVYAENYARGGGSFLLGMFKRGW